MNDTENSFEFFEKVIQLANCLENDPKKALGFSEEVRHMAAMILRSNATKSKPRYVWREQITRDGLGRPLKAATWEVGKPESPVMVSDLKIIKALDWVRVVMKCGEANYHDILPPPRKLPKAYTEGTVRERVKRSREEELPPLRKEPGNHLRNESRRLIDWFKRNKLELLASEVLKICFEPTGAIYRHSGRLEIEFDHPEIIEWMKHTPICDR